MLLYSIIMFLASVPMFIVSILIYQGKTDLIHDYHQTKVTDKVAYGKAFGKAMLVVSMSLLMSGIVSLFGDTKIVATISLTVLFVGLGIGIASIITALASGMDFSIFSLTAAQRCFSGVDSFSLLALPFFSLSLI